MIGIVRQNFKKRDSSIRNSNTYLLYRIGAVQPGPLVSIPWEEHLPSPGNDPAEWGRQWGET